MSEERIRKHLRAALDEIVTTEKTKLHNFYDERDAYKAKSTQMMKHLIDALYALRSEVGQEVVFELSEVSSKFHTTDLFEDKKITVSLVSPSIMPISVSTNYGRGSYYIDDLEYSSVEDVLRPVLDAVGKCIASKHVLSERNI